MSCCEAGDLARKERRGQLRGLALHMPVGVGEEVQREAEEAVPANLNAAIRKRGILSCFRVAKAEGGAGSPGVGVRQVWLCVLFHLTSHKP